MHSTSGPFANVSRKFRQIGRSPASWAWSVLVLLIYLVIHPDSVRSAIYYGSLGLSRDGFLSGKLWQIFSYGFLHGAWWHAGVNALFVLLIGSRIEFILGRRVLASVIGLGIVGGGAGHLLLGSGTLVGLSGACLALLLLLTTLSPQSRMFPVPLSGRSLGLGILAAELSLALMHPDLELPGFSAIGRILVEKGCGAWFEMGHACHAGGGLAGWLCGRWLLRQRVSLDRLRRDRARREAA